MDLERMKKINSMIPELKKQGFAKDNSEAALQSDALFRNQEEGESVIQSTSHVVGERPAEPAPLEQAPEATASTAVNTQVVAQVGALEQKVASLENDINAIIEKMNEMIQAITTLEKGVASAPQQGPRETQQTIAPKAQEKKQENHVRSGDYTSSDVDINKIFYYGNK